jgi:tRNA (guanine-N7-)-methyltransferase
MVRERVSNRTFRDAYILNGPLPEGPLDFTRLFERQAPLELDLGCGRGRFLLARAAAHPEVNFIGIDRVRLRLRKLDRRADEARLSNIRMLCGDAADLIRAHIPAGTVSACYVFFPDPWPKRRHHPRRLISAEFVGLLAAVLTPGGCIHVATDHGDYFQAIRRVWDIDPRFTPAEPYVPAEAEETDFGVLFQSEGRVIGRCSYRRRDVSSAG